MKLRPIFFFICFSFFAHPSDAQIKINEWMASNSIFNDPDFNESSDWIEVINDSPTPVDLSNYYLSDNLNNPTKWNFPDQTIISPMEIILVWADGLDTGLHCNFKLSKSGESIALFHNDALIDSVTFGLQKRNVSMGLKDDKIGYFLEPSPGLENDQRLYNDITYREVSFSKLGGLHQSTFELHLETIDGDIRYTLDGSFPTENSLLYNFPIIIDTTSIVRASVFKEDEIPGKTKTQSYFFEENHLERKLPIISIATNPEYFWDSLTGLYVQDFKPEWEYPINIELFENDGSDRAAFNELAGIKVNGQNSWVLPQKMLGIYFDSDYDKNNLEFPLFHDRARNEFENFTLRASGSDWTETLFRDGLSQQMTDQFMELDRMGFKPCIVYVNGDYLGIHNLRSRVDDSYIEQNFSKTDSTYSLIENESVEAGLEDDFKVLTDLFQQDFTQESTYASFEELMDIENFTDYFITEIWTGNSSYGHNIQMWKPSSENSKWKWILNDLDRGFSFPKLFGLDYFLNQTEPEAYEYARNYLRKTLSNEHFKDYFVRRFSDHLYTSFNPPLVNNIIDQRASTIAEEIKFHVGRWAGTTSDYGDGINTVDEWVNDVQGLKTFTEQRKFFIEEDLKKHFNLDSTALLSIINYPKNHGSTNFNNIKIPEDEWSGNYFRNLPITLVAEPKPGHEFEGWYNGTKVELINSKSEWSFLDSGQQLPENWNKPEYDHSSWPKGNGPLGYGNGNESTIISFGANPNDKHLSYYFRKKITISDLNDFGGLIHLKLLRDDGAIVYLNGHEIVRSNMPGTDVDHLTKASETAYEEEETKYFEYDLNTSLLTQGENLIAVEIHQVSKESSDVSFDLSLDAIYTDWSELISNETSIEFVLTSDSILVANYLQTYPCILKDTLFVDRTLSVDCSPYFITSDLVVNENVDLKIEPGVELHFDKGCSLIAHGSINAIGTEDSLIIFKAYDDLQPWDALIFHETTDTSLLQWCMIEKASKGDHPIYENASISAFKSVLKLNYITIEDVISNPILAYYSDVQLLNSRLHSKVTGDLINIKYGKGLVENNIFQGNNEVDTDAIDYDEVTDGIIKGNYIYNFKGFNSDGIDLGENSINVSLIDNFIYNCADKGISVGQQSSINVINNIISNCNAGIAIKDLSTAYINRSTFYNNGRGIYSFEKSIGIGGGFAGVENSILSNSYLSSIEQDELSNNIAINNLSDSDTIFQPSNHTGHPRFINPVQFNFDLSDNSDAKNLGLDDLNNPIDLGAQLNHLIPSADLMISAIHYDPLIHENFEFIELYNPSNEIISLLNYQIQVGIEHTFSDLILGPQEKIRIAKNSLLHQGIDYLIDEWSAKQLNNEGELIQLIDPFGIVIDHVHYKNELPWPQTNGNGSFLQLKGYNLDNHFAESWEAVPFELNLEDDKLSQNVSIFPNPSTDFVFIVSKENPVHLVEIFNSLGQKVLERSYLNDNQIYIHLANLNPGAYYLLINSEMTKKLIISN